MDVAQFQQTYYAAQQR